MPTTTRRDLLKVGLHGLAAVSLSGTVPAFLSKMAFADTPATTRATGVLDNILVVVQLSGGNDGLNTVIPTGHDAYLKARPNLALKGDRLVRLTDSLSLNPGLAGLKPLFDDGMLAVVNGCGYPKPNRSHFRSMEIWHTAAPESFPTRGWLGHALDHALRGTAGSMSAVNIGQELPQALVAEGPPVPSVQGVDDFRVKTDRGSDFDAPLEQQLIRDLNAARLRDPSPAMQFLSRQATNAIVEADEIRKVAGKYKPDADYPRQGLGNSLRTIAQLISGNFGTRVFYAQTGGYDTHANQLYPHERLLGDVATSLAAFYKDLKSKGIADKVTTLCFSEFGRRVAENASGGTDHGAAGPVFVVGGAVKGGVYGEYPSLADLDDGDLKHTVDFRRVYAALLEKWLGCASVPVLGGKFEPLGIV